MNYDVIIIGGGPAGLSAATYASRSKLKTAVIEKGLLGGQIVLTTEVENYPGFEESIGGFDLVDKMKVQAEKFGTEFLYEEVRAIGLEGICKTVETDKHKYNTKALIFATGANPRKMAVPGEEKYTGRGVSYCATCDGALYRNKTVAVVGGGDSAIEEGLFLTKFAKKVYVIHRRDKLRANPAIQERAFANEKMEFIWDTVVQEVEGSDFVENLKLYNRKDDKYSNLAVDGVFVYVGIIPNNGLLESRVELDSQGFIMTDEEMHTKIPGVYAAGDIVHKVLRQVVTATSDGAIAAFSAEKWIEENMSKFPKE